MALWLADTPTLVQYASGTRSSTHNMFLDIQHLKDEHHETEACTLPHPRNTRQNELRDLVNKLV